MNHTMFVPAPKSVGCLSFEDHLGDSIFTTGEGTVHALQMEHDEDTSTTQSTSSAMTSGDSI